MTSFVDYNPTMATASMTMASHSMDHNPSSVMSSTIDHHVESREESIENLKSNLIRYTRSNDRRMVLRSLKDVSFLSYIPMEATAARSDVSLSELENEVLMEKVVLNEVLLKPPSEMRTLKNAGRNSGCVTMIKGLTQALCQNSKMDGNTVYERVLLHLAKSSASSDIYFQLDSILGSTELNIKALTSGYSVKSRSTVMNQNNITEDGEPSNLKLYNTGGQIHMILDSTINFGLFRKNDTVANRPWIVMKCKIYERTNLCTNEGFRSLSVETPNLY